MKSLLLKARAKKQKWKKREKEEMEKYALEDDYDSDQSLPREESKSISKSDIISSLEALSMAQAQSPQQAGSVTAKKTSPSPEELQTHSPKGNNPSTVKILQVMLNRKIDLDLINSSVTIPSKNIPMEVEQLSHQLQKCGILGSGIDIDDLKSLDLQYQQSASIPKFNNNPDNLYRLWQRTQKLSQSARPRQGGGKRGHQLRRKRGIDITRECFQPVKDTESRAVASTLTKASLPLGFRQVIPNSEEFDSVEVVRLDGCDNTFIYSILLILDPQFYTLSSSGQTNYIRNLTLKMCEKLHQTYRERDYRQYGYQRSAMQKGILEDTVWSDSIQHFVSDFWDLNIILLPEEGGTYNVCGYYQESRCSIILVKIDNFTYKPIMHEGGDHYFEDLLGKLQPTYGPSQQEAKKYQAIGTEQYQKWYRDRKRVLKVTKMKEVELLAEKLEIKIRDEHRKKRHKADLIDEILLVESGKLSL